MMKLKPYRVFFKVDNTNSTRILHLHNGAESEAIETIYRSGGISRDRTIIIMSIEPV